MGEVPTNPKRVEIELSEPVIGHGGQVKKVILRLPRAGDFFVLGEPIAYARKGDGTTFAVENIEVLSSYIQRLLVEPDALIFESLSLQDALAVKEAVLDFFGKARLKLSAIGSGS
jgi:hypothetical protein